MAPHRALVEHGAAKATMLNESASNSTVLIVAIMSQNPLAVKCFSPKACCLVCAAIGAMMRSLPGGWYAAPHCHRVLYVSIGVA
jgi:hypothetical protein